MTVSATGRRNKKDMIITVKKKKKGLEKDTERLIMVAKEWASCTSDDKIKIEGRKNSMGIAVRFQGLLAVLLIIIPVWLEIIKLVQPQKLSDCAPRILQEIQNARSFKTIGK